MYEELLKVIWDNLYDHQKDVLDTIEKFFHPNYEQFINGVIMNRNEYIHHVIEQRKNMIINSIKYKNILEKQNELFAIYYANGENLKNMPIEAEVIAYFQFKGQRIIRIHGLVRLIKGDLADVDMNNQ